MKDIHDVLRTHWGYATFRPLQESVIDQVLAGHDTLALLPTGGGKSLCYQVPALAMGKLCLVVSPLIALMKDQTDRLKQQGIPAKAMFSGMAYAELENALEACALGKSAFLYVSPERLRSELFLARADRLPVGLIAVDEAHCISQWGYDFRPAYMAIQEVRAKFPGVPVLALTATATPEVAKDIMIKLAFRKPGLLRAPFQRPELSFWVSQCEDKLGRLLRIARKIEGSGIVYLRDRKGTGRIARSLNEHGISAAAYHAGLSMEERDAVQRDWTVGKVRFVAATNAFGMGIDKGNVRAVVHMDLPPDLESWYQEAGRAGRDGSASYAFLLHGPGDDARARERLLSSYPSLAEVRQVYQSFADTHHIALGAGKDETYSLDLRDLAKRTQLHPASVLNALKALELNEDIALSDGLHSPSRVLLTTGPKAVYGLRINDQRLGPLLEALLRLYGGLFEEAALIEELRIAQHLQWSVSTVKERLSELQRLGHLSYVASNNAPAVTLMVPRRDAQRLMLNADALAARKQRASARLEAMIAFADPGAQCRERAALAYFGESTNSDCGRCDRCAARRSTDPDSRAKARWEADEGLHRPRTP
ncbi:MAG: RecQ family ATP-dependent DNA helicase [Flavobacteriales bacterium]|nr:RecQ family ATP-dependent DNA helicase [Flavobacteriales bacterium]